MFSYQRLNELFYQLKINSYATSAFLSNKLNVSERTIRSDIQTINQVLTDHGAQIQLKRRVGYYLNIENKAMYQQFINTQSTSTNHSLRLNTSEERIKFILFKLLYAKTYIRLDELANTVFISKNTIHNYVRNIIDICDQYNLEFISKPNEGVKIIGSEEDIRRCLLDNVLSYNFQNYITGFTKEEYTLFKGIDLVLIEVIVARHLKVENINSTDFNRKNLIIHFALMISRNQNDNEIMTLHDFHMENDISDSLNNIITDLEKEFTIVVNQAEKKYIYSHFVSNTDLKTNTDNKEHLHAIINEILNIIYQNYHFDLRTDDILKKDLFLHFHSILKAKEFRLNKRNPLLNTIKNNFPLPYEITLTSTISVLDTYHLQLTEDEVGYISLHIGAAIERCFNDTQEQKNAILICGSGQATTRMLEARINACFKNQITIIRRISYNEFMQMKKQDFTFVDFAISTVSVESDFLPIIIVNFGLDNKDIEALSIFLNDLTARKSKKIDNFFDENIFIKGRHFKNKNELLSTMSNYLLENDFVDEDFYASVLKRESIGNTNMNQIFALPHAFEHNAKQTKVAVAVLESPLEWAKGVEVQIVFMLAISQEDHHDIEHLYDIFAQIINNTKLQNEIINANSFETFTNLLVQSL